MSLRQLKIELVKPKANKRLHILRVHGFINARTNRDFEGSLEDALAVNKVDVVIDMQDLNYLNSTGLATLINYCQAFKAHHREIVLIRIPQHVAVIIYQMGLAEVIPILSNEQEAQKYLERHFTGSRVFNNWQAYLEKKFPEKVYAPPRQKSRLTKGKYSVLVIEPQMDEFVQVLKLRLHNRNARFIVVHDSVQALTEFRKANPEVVVIRHTGPESDEIVRKLKIDLARPLVSVTKIYAKGTDLEAPANFKIWENDFFVEPFDIMELFTLTESEIQRVRTDRKSYRHQLNYRFATEEAHIARAAELTEHLIQQSNLSEESGTRLLSAYNEAVDNARRHGHLDNPRKMIDTVYTLDEDTISIQITDEGEGFDYSSWTRDLKSTSAIKRAQKAKSQGQKGGLGILLMFKCCSKVSYHGRGNIVLLEQSIKS